MNDFRVIVKVNKADPVETLRTLGQLVCDDPESFTRISNDSDNSFVQKQDYVTAVPIEIALTTEMRAHLIYTTPGLRFIVTGVPVGRIESLAEWGYKVYPSILVDADEKEEDEDNRKEPGDECPAHDLCEDEGKKKDVEDDPRDEPEEKKEEQLPAPQPEESKYWYNGRKVTKEEFLKHKAEFEEVLKRSGFFFKDWLKAFNFFAE